MDYKNWFKNFLEEYKFLPLSKDNWNNFDIEHGEAADFKSNLLKIREQVNKKSGIYVYKKGEKILYVGKAVSLFGRIKSHNRESFEPVPGDTEWNTWHKFFSGNKGKLSVYWKEVLVEEERLIIEKMLQYILNPEFEFFKKKFKGKINE